MNTITGIIGKRGHGKTLLMTALAYMDWHSGRKIVSNYKLMFDGTDKPANVEYMSFADICRLPKSLKDCTVVLDELQEGADSRAIFHRGNKALTKLATQLRKRHITLYYSTQHFGQIDIRLRRQTDQLLLVNARGMPQGWTRIEIYENGVKDLNKLGDKIFNGTLYFPMYDTDEIIHFDPDTDDFDLELDESNLETYLES